MRTLISILSFISLTTGLGQSWVLIKEVPMEMEITSVSVDNKDQFYIGLSSGSLIRYTASGEEDQYFSLINNAPITTVEAWNRLKIFTFFRDQQRIEVLDRFTSTPRSMDLTELGVPYIWLATPGIDNSLWTLNTSLKELRKYDEQNLNLLTTIPLKNDLEIVNPVFMRAFNKYLFLIDSKKGLFTFDQYGSFKNIFSAEGIEYCQVLDGKVVFLLNDSIFFIDPENLEILQKLKTPEDGVFNKVVISGGYYIFFSQRSFSIYIAR